MRAGRTAHFGGLAAEEIAARLYAGEGGRLLASRWRRPEGEIDLVLALPDTLVFVEVKARASHAAAAASVTPRQRARLVAAAGRFLAESGEGDRACRFDVVTVDRTGRAERIVDAFGA